VIGSLADAPDANALLIGIAPPGGRLPAPWRRLIHDAIDRGMDVVSGMHEFLNDDPEFAHAAAESDVRLVDIRNNRMTEIARGKDLREDCLRIHTVGHDCSIGKMVTAYELTRGLNDRGLNAKFAATGQTGIVVEGDGYPVDCMVADFVSGAAERLVLDNQHHDVVVVEGQGSLVHPSYSGVTLGLLHGCQPHGMIMCYEVGRTCPHGLDHLSLPPLGHIIQMYETMASLWRPCQVIGIAINSRTLTPEQAEEERERARDEFGVPVCDIFRHGIDDLVDAVIQLKDKR
jgi:uncharacterized NAD-dependent epimerase/dehydratase family protein